VTAKPAYPRVAQRRVKRHPTRSRSHLMTKNKTSHKHHLYHKNKLVVKITSNKLRSLISTVPVKIIIISILDHLMISNHILNQRANNYSSLNKNNERVNYLRKIKVNSRLKVQKLPNPQRLKARRIRNLCHLSLP